MRIKYTISIVFFVALVIIEKENNIISRVSDKLTSRQTLGTPLQPLASFFDHRPKRNVSRAGLGELRPSPAPVKRRPANRTQRRPAGLGNRKHILLLSTTRSGSSFIGEFFNQQSESMFYLYEPLWHVEKMLTLEAGGVNSTAANWAYPEVLRQLFLCDFSLLESFIEPAPVDHVTAGLFRRSASGSLCEESVCGPPAKGVFEHHSCKNRRCGPLNLTAASQACLQKAHRAIKLVRVRQLQTLRPLAEEPRLDVRFVHLVRDPRAVLASRMVAFAARYKNWKQWAAGGDVPMDDQEVAKLKGNCNNLRLSAELGLNPPEWLRGRYMLVRYEDIARFPLQKAAEMYGFVGIPLTVRVKAWIRRNTQASKETSGIYSTQKKSSDQVEKWRFNMPFKIVQVIQEVCGSTLELFGYKLVSSEEMLTDKSVSLIEEKVFE